MFSCTLEVLPNEQRRVCGGGDNRHMVLIAQRTGVRIKHPSLAEASHGATTFMFSGKRVPDIISARRHVVVRFVIIMLLLSYHICCILQGLLPVQLSFEVAEHQFVSDVNIDALERELNVQVQTKLRVNPDGQQSQVRT